MYVEGEFQLVKVWVLSMDRRGDVFTFADEDFKVVKDYYDGLADIDKKFVVGLYTSIAVKDKKGNIYSIWKDDDSLDIPDTFEGLPMKMGGETYDLV